MTAATVDSDAPANGPAEWTTAGDAPPSLERARDFLSGGGHNFDRDRAIAHQIEDIMPAAKAVIRLEFAFAERVVRFLVEQGIRQFLQLGPGLAPSTGVPQLLDRLAPDSVLVCVDEDDIAVAHWELKFAGHERRSVVKARLGTPEVIVHHPSVRQLLDFTAPVAVLMFQAHAIASAPPPRELARRYMDHVADGSYLAIAHMATDVHGQEVADIARLLESSNCRERWSLRNSSQIAMFVADLDVADPGLTGIGLWRPGGVNDTTDSDTLNRQVFGGVGRKPAASRP